MRNLLLCRRTFICTLSILCLTAIGLVKGIDVSMAMATVAIGLAGANAYEKSREGKTTVIATEKAALYRSPNGQ